MRKKECIAQLEDLKQHCQAMIMPDDPEGSAVWERDVQALRMAIAAVRGRQSWVLCSDRQPREPGEYIVTIAGAANATALLWDGMSWFEPADEEPDGKLLYPVEKWMELPEV